MCRAYWFVSSMILTVALLPKFLPPNTQTALALDRSVGTPGIDARRLHVAPYNLTGKDICIGQIELSRPGQFAVDKIVNRLIQLDRVAIEPFEVFFRDGKPVPNRNLDDHSAQVAAVMISRNKIHQGVAPQAKLLSSAYAQRRRDGQPEAVLAAQYVARQCNSYVRALNFSFGEPLNEDPRPKPKLDGNALLTLSLDWLAITYNTLPVVAGNQGKGGIPIPTDLYNGIVVGFTRDRDGVYSQLDRGNLIDEPFIDRNGNGRYDAGEYFTDLNKDGKWTPGVESPTDGRRSLALLAPGNNVMLPDLKGKFISANGTSFASPHVVGTIALLQEYADRQILSEQWGVDARRHEIIKAVLINSADKIKDTGDGKALGMSKTILDAYGKNWLDSEAYRSRDIPLSLHLGAGQLNAARAIQQFQAGQQSPGTVSAIGWDSHVVEAAQYQEYIFAEPLMADSFVAITLTWDRLVNLNDKNGNRLFDIGESFKNSGINNLDLYLMREQDNDISQNVWSSVSKIDNLQHIFVKIPAAGRYKIRVVFNTPQNNEPIQRYGLAWWTAPVKR
ncbi:S8 family serine peptidase [Tumidithrix helvetica]|uniref:S8 family serine peptidase n=1 Tax=Tumidithrix helvetica TaxID=3457545 RepID=UPI003CC54D67